GPRARGGRRGVRQRRRNTDRRRICGGRRIAGRRGFQGRRGFWKRRRLFGCRRPEERLREQGGTVTPRTLIDKIWDAHVVRSHAGEPDLLYVDLHLVHEVTSPQAFEGLRLHGRKVRRPDLTFATLDHNVPTTPRTEPITDPISRLQIEALERNCREFGIRLEGLRSQRQGIVHIIGPELGLTQPGMLIVCGDSHTATHGALGAVAFGVGASEVVHGLAGRVPRPGMPRTSRPTTAGRSGSTRARGTVGASRCTPRRSGPMWRGGPTLRSRGGCRAACPIRPATPTRRRGRRSRARCNTWPS